ncbi:DNA internalization-related competence protein ComEC/Rec2 [Alteromonas sp. KUL106]|uniref:DNA internalization-related competence protein ComEC/Rec2 n=1 Tax=Alteromonas sp. KUL106 TaxID=2480799 RepID=UPI001F41F4C0|nr:DNA internalization-related competence protein ComEC/Rec2 [Alteromonas sp. KUL106]
MLAIVLIANVVIVLFWFHCRTNKQTLIEAQLCLALSGLLVGVLWVASLGHFYHAWQLPPDKIQQDVTILGRVISGGCVSKSATDANAHRHYIVAIQAIDEQRANDFLNPSAFNSLLSFGFEFRARLSQTQVEFANTKAFGHSDTPYEYNSTSLSYTTPLEGVVCLHDGDVFTALVKLKPAYGFANPVGFNRQQHLVSQFIQTTGYIKQVDAKTINHHHNHRYALGAWLSSLELFHHSWWSALLLGNKTLFTDDDWTILQRTGTGHLFSISGMHLSIVAGVCFLLLMPFIFVFGQGIILLSPLKRFTLSYSTFMSQQKGLRFRFTHARLRILVLLSVIIACCFYALLSGMALPVVRALLLLAIASWVTISKVAWRPVNIGLAMLALCLVLFPFSILNASFYLSIGAVICIWFFVSTLSIQHGRWYFAAAKLQIALTFIMMPLTTIWFSNVSVISLVANLAAMPIVTVLLPICLISLLISYFFSHAAIGQIGTEIIKYSDHLFGYLLSLLTFLSELNYSAFNLFVSTSSALCFLGAIILFCLPKWRFKYFCILLLLLPLVTSLGKWLPPNDEHWALHVLDAGQASAIAVSKGDRAIIIDSGAIYRGNATTATQALFPLLDSIKVQHVDHVIHTHSDNDHAGGLAAVMAHPFAKNAKFYSPTLGCERNAYVDWQGLSIRFLWPLKGNEQDNNAMSCVVKISGRSGSVLIPGDIEKESEYALITKTLNEETSTLKADILIAPHHGSDTSSTDIFIKHVSPKAVIYTQGYENRWKFPAVNVVERYKRNKVVQFFTSYDGYTIVSFEKDDYHVNTQRGGLKKRWYLKARAPRHLEWPIQ